MRILDSFMPLMAYVVRLQRAPDEARPEYRQAREEILRLMEQSETASRVAGLDQDLYSQARFAVCAWVDETVLGSGWQQRWHWQHEQLQRLHYRTTEAGVEFFERLEALGPEERDVREVYALCLALGFRGRYIGKGDDLLLEQLKVSNLAVLLGSPSGLPVLEGMELFPGASAASATAPLATLAPALPAPFAALLLAAPLILFGLLYLVFRYVLNGLVLPIL